MMATSVTTRCPFPAVLLLVLLVPLCLCAQPLQQDEDSSPASLRTVDRATALSDLPVRQRPMALLLVDIDGDVPAQDWSRPQTARSWTCAGQGHVQPPQTARWETRLARGPPSLISRS